MPGDVLAGDDAFRKVFIEAAIEELIRVHANSPLELMKAAYHLGNRHVALELKNNELFLLKDPVLADMLLKRELKVEQIQRPFHPESGAYLEAHHHH